uniref:Galanin/GMAP prepropeptide n=1 Tax=Cyprinus carpio carpio TaxID=630221 RepID=A0A9J8C7U8_CYPCA
MYKDFILQYMFIEPSLYTTYSIKQEKEKRGWTLNSAGYLLGPHAIDSHRSLSDKHGVAGKREMPIEDDFKTGKKHAPPVGTHQRENPKRICVN